MNCRRGILAFVAGCLLAGSLGCDPPGKPDPARHAKELAESQDFAGLFRRHCAGCHGVDGRLGPAPPLDDPLFLAIVPDEELAKVIGQGRPGTPMPAFGRAAGGPLNDEQITTLVAGLRSTWGNADAKPENAPAYLITNSDADKSADRGAVVFAKACAECHGAEGQGDEGLAGAINDPAFLALISDQALRRLVITGRPDLGMPNYAETNGRPSDYRPLTSSEVDDLMAFLAAWRKPAEVATNEDITLVE